MAARFLERNFLAFMAGIVLIVVALNIVLLRLGVLSIWWCIIGDVALIGLLVLLYGAKIAAPRDRVYYTVWGLLMILASVTATSYVLTGDTLIAAAVGLAGLGGVILVTIFAS